jgi:MFS transporter, DHA2 family, multidrug resistance protein
VSATATAAAPDLGGSRALVATALALGTFMQVLDTTIANVSIPTIAGNLGVSSDQGTWVITSFAVANGISVPLTGWLMQRFGVVKVFVASVVMFTVASLLCGASWSLTSLVMFRVLQGLVSGPMVPGSQALLLTIFPPHRKGAALAIWSMTTLVAPIMGPILGGHISDNYSWPWIFYINVPVGLVAAAFTWSIYRTRETPTRRLPIDSVGLGLLVLWIGALQIMLDKGKELDWFHSPQIVTLAVVAVVGFVVFLIWELTEEHPIVELSLFRLRNFWTGTLTMSLGYGLFFGNVVLLPLWLQQYMGYTATDAGMVMAPVGLLAIIFSPIVGRSVHKVDPRIFATTSFFVFALVMWMRSQFSTQVDFETILIPTVIQGFAVAFFFIPLVTLTLSGLEPERIASASGLSNFARITAGAIGTSVTTTLWDDRATVHHVQLTEQINSGSVAATGFMHQLAAAGLTPSQIAAQMSRMIDQQAYMLSANDVFAASAVLFLILIGVVWLARPVKTAAPVDAGGAH